MLRGAWRVILYGIIVVVWGLLTSCGGAKTNAGATPAKGTYVGGTVCQGCHGATHTSWLTTKHSGALKTLENIGQGANTACLGCHTTGYGATTGFVSRTETPGLADVQCEMCHGPGSDHAAGPGANPLPTLLPSSVCGKCHTGTHNPQYDEWKHAADNNTTGHSRSLGPIQSRPTATTECIACHSGERFVQILNESVIKGRQTPMVIPQPQGDKATTNVECWTCHDPHEKRTTTINQLRKPVKDLCVTCHTFHQTEGVLQSPQTPRHGQIFFGDTGLNADGTKLSGPNSAHTTVTKNACADCHVYSIAVTQPTTGSPNITGHTFEPNLKACTQSGCHVATGRPAIEDGADPGILKRFNDTQAAVQARLTGLAAYFDSKNALYINPNKLSVADRKKYDVAKWDRDEVSADSSLGIHNYLYTKALLDTAEAILKALPQVK